MTPSVVVYWTVDTLGRHAAESTSWCDDMSAILDAHGLDAACLDGGVSPSSWTVESHARMLWPTQNAGLHRHDVVPACDGRSSLRVTADAIGGKYFFGADNPVMFADREWNGCADGGRFDHEADVAFGEFQPIADAATAPEEERAARQALEAALDETATGAPAVLFLNDLEAGGHVPRCWFEPDAASCQALWSFAVSSGMRQSTDDPATEFLDEQFWLELATALDGASDADRAAVRAADWDTVVEAIEHFRTERLDGRLDDLLTGLEEQDRLGDLLLVMLGDHGENPCIALPFSGAYSCEHGDEPTAWTTQVPVLVSPASAAQGWKDADLVGDDDAPWSTSNLGWGVLRAVHGEQPDAWPDPTPPGTATTWTCRSNQTAGIAVSGGSAIRCDGTECEPFAWEIPDGPTWEPTTLDEVPTELQPLAQAQEDGAANGFDDICNPRGPQ